MSVGCAANATYTPPIVQPVPAFKENANWKAAQPRDAYARDAWWEVFNDPALTANVDYGVDGGTEAS